MSVAFRLHFIAAIGTCLRNARHLPKVNEWIVRRGLGPLEATVCSTGSFRDDFDSKISGFWLLDSASIQRWGGGQQAAAAHALIFGTDGTFQETVDNSDSYKEGSITVACYLCNTFLKTAQTGPFRVVLLLRVQNCSGMLIGRRRGASRGRPVKWFA